ncbi:MAG: ParB/RepB/Spo0J family partition protein [Dysgonamonadaceae bacterium]|jgi:ParB family chromosome partitioning protein|nr:ParB/RepB/Spo0J family partition protein [Dysgonamonadaceae bacterium]
MAKLPKSALGRGLDALIQMDDVKTNGTSSISEIELSKIVVNKDQPRTIFDQEALEELAASISSLGLVQPITLREIGKDQYQIISGERRFRASKLAGLETIPAYIRKASDEHVMEMALIENIQREDLNPIEISLAFQNLIESYNLTQDKLSERIGKKRATVANFLRLLKLPAGIQMGLKDKKIDMGHAKAILGVDDPTVQLEIYDQILKGNFSVRKTEEIVRENNDEKAKKQQKPVGEKDKISEDYLALEALFSDLFETKIQFTCNKKGQGKITIPFQSEKDLERITSIFDSLKK